jgi:hypothetical protein
MKTKEDFWIHSSITFFCVIMGLYTWHTGHIAIACVVFGLATLNLIGAVGDYLWGGKKDESKRVP